MVLNEDQSWTDCKTERKQVKYLLCTLWCWFTLQHFFQRTNYRNKLFQCIVKGIKMHQIFDMQGIY